MKEQVLNMRIWAKEIQDNHLLKDVVICNDENNTRTQKVISALDDICNKFDLSKPIWLDSNIHEFQIHAKTRFKQDNFIESIPFDYLEFHVIEED